MGQCIWTYRCREGHGWPRATFERLELLCSVFAVELCSYAIMSNHYHLVVRLAPIHSESWSDDEVMNRWEKIYGIATPIAIGLSEAAFPAKVFKACLSTFSI